MMELQEILERYKQGSLTMNQAVDALQRSGYGDLGFAKVDYQRKERVGYPEVIFCQGKAPEHLQGIVQAMLEKDVKNILATRADEEAYRTICQVAPQAEYHELARIVAINRAPIPKRGRGTIAVVTAGTADIPVAEEAAVTAQMLGNDVTRIYDVGVAGIHRLLGRIDEIRKATVAICVAGMEGALASVVGGLVDRPVVAVPTSVGYGASFSGLSALLTMLNSCASGVGVVNIDNGFGAGYLAASINRE